MSYRYEVPVEKLDRPIRVSKELSEQLREALGKVSGKMLNEMKREAVQCPVLGQQVPFLQCYMCKNFVRRVRGVVHCKGEPLS